MNRTVYPNHNIAERIEKLIRALSYDRNQYDKGWRDCQEMVEEKCRKLGIDYIAIFTEQESE